MIEQPGASRGDRAYCLVSGVVFTVKEKSPSAEIGGRTVFFCCASCAQWFAANRERVLAARGLAG